MVSAITYALPLVIVALVIYFNNKLAKLTATIAAQRKVAEFHSLLIRFSVETDFRSKTDLAMAIRRTAEKNYQSEVVLPFGYVNIEELNKYLQEQLVNYLVDKTAGMSLVKTVKFLEEALEEVWSSEFTTVVTRAELLKAFARKSDFGFLVTLREIYGAEHTDGALQQFESAKRTYDAFAEKFSVYDRGISNNLFNIEEEINTQGKSAIKLITQSWIMRAGKPSAYMYRKLQEAIES